MLSSVVSGENVSIGGAGVGVVCANDFMIHVHNSIMSTTQLRIFKFCGFESQLY
jgi:hypothetical protein